MSSANTSSEANRDDGCDWYFGVPFPSKRKAAAVKERELKVGDRVRTDGCFTFDPVRGVVVEARDGGVYRVRAESLHAEMGGRDTWTYYASELTLLPPTFAPNTRVRLIRNTQRYAVGDTGTVTLSSDESVGVRMDDGRYWSFKPEDLVVVPVEWTVTTDHKGFVTGLRRDDAALANDHATPCIVACVDNGQPRPSSWPHVHPSAASATKEAERLASINPGKQFDVYQRVTGRVGDVQVREVA